jgi:hypothetical protein
MQDMLTLLELRGCPGAKPDRLGVSLHFTKQQKKASIFTGSLSEIQYKAVT